jgi:hypothetical protein
VSTPFKPVRLAARMTVGRWLETTWIRQSQNLDQFP